MTNWTSSATPPPAPSSRAGDVLIVASVSCIYGLGSPETYHGMHIYLKEGQRIDRDEVLTRLVADPVSEKRH